MNVARSPFKQGSLIASRYRVETLLGAGGMGWVFRVRDQRMQNQSVALKVLYPHLLSSDSSYARILNEVSVTRRLSHPSIVQTFGFGKSEQNAAYIAMEFVDGETLTRRIQANKGILVFEEVERILIKLLLGLEFAHQRGIIHRDLKPDNILIRKDAELKIADFGLAQMFRQESNLTGKGMMVGTPHYMSPEQIRGEPLSVRSDIYSLGILAYEMVVGKTPFDGETLYDVAEQHLNRRLVLPSDVKDTPAWFEELLEGCSAKNPDERFSSVSYILGFLKESGKLDVPESRYQRKASKHTQDFLINPLTPWLRARSFALWVLGLLLVGLFGAVMVVNNNQLAEAAVAYPIFSLERRLNTELRLTKAILGVRGRYGDVESYFNLSATPSALSFIEAGMDPNLQDPTDGNTLLHRWSRYLSITPRNLDKVHRLLKLGADPNIPNFDGQLPLHSAATIGAFDVLELLLLYGAEKNSLNKKGNSALHRFVKNKNYRGAELMLKHGADPNLASSKGQRPVHLAARKHDLEMLRLLFEFGAKAELQDLDGKNALMVSIGKRMTSSKRREVLELLVEKAPLDALDYQGRSAFVYAQDFDDTTAKELLEEKGKSG